MTGREAEAQLLEISKKFFKTMADDIDRILIEALEKHNVR